MMITMKMKDDTDGERGEEKQSNIVFLPVSTPRRNLIAKSI